MRISNFALRVKEKPNLSDVILGHTFRESNSADAIYLTRIHRPSVNLKGKSKAPHSVERQSQDIKVPPKPPIPRAPSTSWKAFNLPEQTLRIYGPSRQTPTRKFFYEVHHRHARLDMVLNALAEAQVKAKRLSAASNLSRGDLERILRENLRPITKEWHLKLPT